MRKLIFVGMLLFSSLQHQAQQFELRSRVALPASVVHSELAWTDMDNDSLLDVLVIASGKDDTQFLLLYKVDTVPPDTVPVAILKDSIDIAVKYLSYYLADLDLDNDIDIVLSGEFEDGFKTMIAVNEGEFVFNLQPFLDRSGRILKIADLDQDGSNELILSQRSDSSGVLLLSILKQIPSGWEPAQEWIDTDISSIEVFDFDKDGFNDLFLSGKFTGNDSLVCHVFYNHGDLSYTYSPISPPVVGTTSLADVDSNGYFDIVLAGQDSLGRDTTIVLRNFDGALKASDRVLPALTNAKVFAADFNSDGRYDIHLRGTNVHGDMVNVITYDSTVTVFDTLDLKGLQAQRFGDSDRDGDLDLMQVISADTGSLLVLYENITPSVNEPPHIPYNPIGLTIFDRLFLYWEKPIDDHTSSASLTYDLAVRIPEQEWIAGEFDHIWLSRLTVSHGNTGNRNFVLLHAPTSSTYSFSIQAVDNSFHAGLHRGGVCTGVSVHCATLEYESIEVCRNENVTLNAPGNALWFSFSEGLLTQTNRLDYNTSVSDTVFYLLPEQGAGCSSVKAFIVRVLQKVTKKTQHAKYVCEGQPLTFNVEPGWQHVEWSSTSEGFISNDTSVVFTPAYNDTLIVRADDGTGCFIQRSTIFHFSKPSITLNGETFQMLRGSEIQLTASGGETYLWTPSTGLNADTIPNPVASPSNTATYTVTVKDSLGCSAQAKVLVVVETTAFVPNLFTPNGDGNNDELKIYGLDEIKNFTFTIRNREGSLLYETQNITEATTAGWNGIVRGEKQPSGVYYWKVNGEYRSGRRLLLNGKSSGSIVLVR